MWMNFVSVKLNNLFDDRASAGVTYRTTGGMLLTWGVFPGQRGYTDYHHRTRSHSYHHGRSEPSSFISESI